MISINGHDETDIGCVDEAKGRKGKPTVIIVIIGKARVLPHENTCNGTGRHHDEEFLYSMNWKDIMLELRDKHGRKIATKGMHNGEASPKSKQLNRRTDAHGRHVNSRIYRKPERFWRTWHRFGQWSDSCRNAAAGLVPLCYAINTAQYDQIRTAAYPGA